MTTESAAPKPDPGAKAKKMTLKHFLNRNLKENHQRQNWENLLTNHYRSLDATTPIPFTALSCKRQQYYAGSRGTKQPWRSHYNAISRYWTAKHKRTTRNIVRNCISKTGPRRQSEQKKQDLEALLKRSFRRKITSAKIEKIQWQITIATLMQPLQYDSRPSAAKDNSITHAAAAPSNLDAAITMRYQDIELQNAIELRATAWEIAAPKLWSTS